MSDEYAKTWLGKLTKLNPNIAKAGSALRGKAPHKPLLLLSLLDMAEAGELTGRTFARSAGLALRFRSYGTIVADRWPTRLDLRMPFYYLKSQKFWEPFNSQMQPASSPESCLVCDMHPESSICSVMPVFRRPPRRNYQPKRLSGRDLNVCSGSFHSITKQSSRIVATPKRKGTWNLIKLVGDEI
ncbi:MAG: hypothetical protein H0X66_12275 [Verrucomicrobia bacterium]|nr:hypothetical protein [Verrucomicrobiota bacterium]